MGETAEERQDGRGDTLQDDPGDVLRTVAAGFVATAVMVVLLFVVQTLYPGDITAFRSLAEFLVGRESLPLGLLVFFVGGTLAWPLMFVSLGTFLPGDTRTRQGVVFALVLWVGFVVALGRQLSGVDIAVFVVVGLVLHVIYGYVLGFLSTRLTGKRRIAGPDV